MSESRYLARTGINTSCRFGVTATATLRHSNGHVTSYHWIMWLTDQWAVPYSRNPSLLPQHQYICTRSDLLDCNGDFFSEISLRSRIPPATPRDPVISIKPPSTRGLLVLLSYGRDRNKKALPEPRDTTNGECWDLLQNIQIRVKLT